MARIVAPNRAYNGVSAGVAFSDGVGDTDVPHLVEWFRQSGYQVEDVPPAPPAAPAPPARVPPDPEPTPGRTRRPTRKER